MKKNKPKLTRCWVVREPANYDGPLVIGVMLESAGTPTKISKGIEKGCWKSVGPYKSWYNVYEFEGLYGLLPKAGSKELWDLEI
jgi:hypothetical protein